MTMGHNYHKNSQKMSFYKFIFWLIYNISYYWLVFFRGSCSSYSSACPNSSKVSSKHFGIYMSFYIEIL